MRFQLNYFEIIIHIGLYRDLLKNFEKHYQKPFLIFGALKFDI